MLESTNTKPIAGLRNKILSCIRGCKGDLSNTNIRVIDFGLAVNMSTLQSMLGFRGTAAYTSPEMQLALPWDFQSDVWSVGIMATEFITGKVLINAENKIKRLAQIQALVSRSYPVFMTRYLSERNKEILTRETNQYKNRKFSLAVSSSFLD
jgi:serine/threonine protein kinase